MIIRRFDSGRDLDAALRPWLEVGWIKDEDGPKAAVKTMLEACSALVYGYGSDVGGTAVLISSIVVMCMVPPPLQWAVTIIAVVVLVDVVIRRIPEMSGGE